MMSTSHVCLSFRMLFPTMVFAAAICGCRHADNTWMVMGKGDSPAAPPSSHNYAYPKEPPVVDAEDVRLLVTRFRDHVVVLDVWAAWNRRCRDEMIGLTQLQQEFGDGTLQVISCNLDGADEWARVTVPVLHGAQANVPCVLLDRASRSTLREWLNPHWTYDLPARFLIDAQGEVAATFFEDASIEQVQVEARRLVGRSGGRVTNDFAPKAAAATPSRDDGPGEHAEGP